MCSGFITPACLAEDDRLGSVPVILIHDWLYIIQKVSAQLQVGFIQIYVAYLPSFLIKVLMEKYIVVEFYST